MKTAHSTADENQISSQASDDHQSAAVACCATASIPPKWALALGALAAGAFALAIGRMVKAPPLAQETVLHVMPGPDKGWQVKSEDANTPDGSFETKKEALDNARDQARASEPSRLVVHGQDGSIQRSHTYGSN